MKALERKRPHCEDHVWCCAKKCFVHYKLVIVVLVETVYLTCLQIQQVHSRSGIAGEFDESVVKRVKLRVNDGARPTQNHIPVAAVSPCHGYTGIALLFDGCDKPFPTVAQTALA